MSHLKSHSSVTETAKRPSKRELKANPAMERAWQKKVDAAADEAKLIERERQETHRREVKAGFDETIAEAKARGEEVAREGGVGPAHIVSRDGLMWLLRKHRILAAHYDAGLRFRGDWELAHRTGPKSNLADLGATHGGFHSGLGPTDAMLQAKDRVMRTLEALGTPMLHVYLIGVAAEGRMIYDEHFGPDPDRRGVHLLPTRIALDLTARHYGLIK